MQKWYHSSAGTGDLSLTIKGILTALIPVIIFAAALAGLPLAEADLMQWIEAITTWVASTMVVVGLLRKCYYWWKNRSQ